MTALKQPKVRTTALLLAGALALAWTLLLVRCAKPTPRSLGVATFNVEFFPQENTDVLRVAARLLDANAEVVALQEMTSREGIDLLVAATARLSRRRYGVVASDCVGSQPIETALLYDQRRLRLLASRTYPGLREDGDGACDPANRSATFGLFEDTAGHQLGLISVHLGAMPERRVVRAEQLDRVFRIAAALEAEFDVEVAILGDLNTTSVAEIDELARWAEFAGRGMPTRALRCSEYWLPEHGPDYLPALLDHALVSTPGWSNPQVGGMCAQLGCRPVPRDQMHADWATVSDHCPVRLDRWWE